MTKRPAFQFYPADWRTDPSLRLCSMLARGLWIEMMAIMHDGDPYGHLTTQGRVISDDMLSRLVGEPAAAIKRALKDLETNGVFSRTHDGIIFSRRMVRDEEIRNSRGAGGSLGKEHGHKGASHGVKGGRPRKQKPPLSDDERGDKKPAPSTSSSIPSSIPSSIIVEGDDGSVKPDSVEEMARLIGNAAGINHNPANDPSRFADNIAHVREWVQLGATIDLMTECARRACAAQSQPIRSFRYLDGPIRQAIAKLAAPAGGKAKGDKPKPLASGGSLFQRLQAGEISQEEFDRERAKLLADERKPRPRGKPVQASIGDVASRVAGGRA